jgi:hypothetical protein
MFTKTPVNNKKISVDKEFCSFLLFIYVLRKLVFLMILVFIFSFLLLRYFDYYHFSYVYFKLLAPELVLHSANSPLSKFYRYHISHEKLLTNVFAN